MSLKYLSILFGVLTIGFLISYIGLTLKVKEVESKFNYEHQDQIDAYYENRMKIFDEWSNTKDSLLNKWVSDFDSLIAIRNSNTQIANKKLNDELNLLREPVAPGIVEINKNAKNKLTITIVLCLIALILAVWYKIIKNNSPKTVVKIRETSNTNLTPLESFIADRERQFQDIKHESGNVVTVNVEGYGSVPVKVGAVENGKFIEPDGAIFIRDNDGNFVGIQSREIIGDPVVRTKQEYLDDMIARFYANQQTGVLANHTVYDFNDIDQPPTKQYSPTPRERFTAAEQQRFEDLKHQSGDAIFVNTEKYGPTAVFSGNLQNGKFVEPTGEIFVYNPETGKPVSMPVNEVIGEPVQRTRDEFLNDMLTQFYQYQQQREQIQQVAFEYEGKQWMPTGQTDDKGNVVVEMVENGDLTGQHIVLPPEEFEQAKEDKKNKK